METFGRLAAGCRHVGPDHATQKVKAMNLIGQVNLKF
jgi:hypothetical protein